MPRYRPGYSRSTVTSRTGAVSETAVVFSSSGGHSHDGSNSSLIDTMKYSIWDFPVNTVYSTTPRASRQTGHIEQFKSFVANIVNTSVLEPAGVVLGDNVINANNIVAGSISSELIAANTIVANNIAANTITTELLAADAIQSDNYSYTSGNFTNAGSFFNLSDGSIRTDSFYLDGAGNMYIAGDVVIGSTAASTIESGAADGASSLQPGQAASDVNSNTTTISGGKIRTGEIQSTGFSWNGSSTYSTTGTRIDLDDGQIIAKKFRIDSSGNAYFAGDISGATGTFTGGLSIGSSNTILRVNSTGDLWIGHATETSAEFRVLNNGTMYARAGTVGGITMASNKLYTGTGTYGNSNTGFYVDSSGNFSLKNKLTWNGTTLTVNGTINATAGSFSGSISSSATITGGTVQTASSGERIVLSGTALNLYSPNSSSNTALIQFNPPSNLYYGRIQSSGSLRIGLIGSSDQIQLGYYSGGLRYGTYWSFGDSGFHDFRGRLRSYSGTYGQDWTNAQIRAEGDSSGAGMAIRAGNDTGTVQLRVGYNYRHLYLRSHDDLAWADLDVGNVYAAGNVNKAGGTFKIHHPLEELRDDYWLYHSFIEGPYADLIYRGVVNLVNGTAQVNIDEHSGMTDGTFVRLVNNVSCFTSNESGWTSVRGQVQGNILTIYAQDPNCSDTVSWMVVGERCDDHMMTTDITDDNGRIIQEQPKTEQDRLYS